MPSSQSSSSRSDRLYSAIAVWVCRLLVGGTFIFSGFVKAIDPWGSFYKIGEYLHSWGMVVSDGLVTAAAFALAGVEFVLGTLLALGCYKRATPVLLTLVMAFMLPLSVYITVANPVEDCGCFGDFLVISNTATLLKNIVICLLLVYLLLYNPRVEGLFHPYVQWVIGGIVTLYIFLIELCGFNIQPMLDFRSFPPGESILGSHSDADIPEYKYVYEKDGSTLEFDMASLPDSTWTFVERRLVSPAQAKEKTDFVVLDGDDDITEDVIDEEGPMLIITVPDLANTDLSFTYIINELNNYITSQGGSLVMLSAGSDAAYERWEDVSMAEYPIYKAEPTLIKELARGRAAVVYLDKGIVQWKRSLTSISNMVMADDDEEDLLSSVDPVSEEFLYFFTTVFLVLIFTLMLLDRSGKLLSWYLKRKALRRKLLRKG